MSELCPDVSPMHTLRALIAGAAPTDLPELAAELARGLAIVLARVGAPQPPAAETRTSTTRYLTVEEAARTLGVPKSWLYRHAKHLSFAHKLGHRTLRFDAIELARWARSRPTR